SAPIALLVLGASGKLECSRPRWGSPRIPRPVRRRGRSPSIWRVIGKSPLARRSRSIKAWNCAGLRCCTLGRPDLKTRWSGSRWVAPPSSSLAASLGATDWFIASDDCGNSPAPAGGLTLRGTRCWRVPLRFPEESSANKPEPRYPEVSPPVRLLLSAASSRSSASCDGLASRPLDALGRCLCRFESVSGAWRLVKHRVFSNRGWLAACQGQDSPQTRRLARFSHPPSPWPWLMRGGPSSSPPSKAPRSN